jgi:hypothetical protein
VKKSRVKPMTGICLLISSSSFILLQPLIRV